jgi:hypothetical protein
MSTPSSHHVYSQQSWGGNDTINLGYGSDTVFEQGQATVQGLFGHSTPSGSALQVIHASFTEHSDGGKATLLGGTFLADFTPGAGKTLMSGGLSLSSDTLGGGALHDTLTSGLHSPNLFQFLSTQEHAHVITNFVAGHSQTYVEGNSFAQLQQHEVSTIGGSTFIKLDGGITTIELKGVTDPTKLNITPHK